MYTTLVKSARDASLRVKDDLKMRQHRDVWADPHCVIELIGAKGVIVRRDRRKGPEKCQQCLHGT
jgi:hypothetical protein